MQPLSSSYFQLFLLPVSPASLANASQTSFCHLRNTRHFLIEGQSERTWIVCHFVIEGQYERLQYERFHIVIIWILWIIYS